MSRVFVIAIAVLVFFWLLRRALGARKSGGQPADAKEGKKSEAVPDLVACAHCGVHLPRSEALRAADGDASGPVPLYCSEEHLRLGRR